MSAESTDNAYVQAPLEQVTPQVAGTVLAVLVDDTDVVAAGAADDRGAAGPGLVEANFKEAQLRRMRIGQTVTLRADLYGRDVVFRGRVAGIASAPVGLLSIARSPWVGRHVHRIDPRWLATVSFVGFAFVLWLRSGFSPQVTLALAALTRPLDQQAWTMAVTDCFALSSVLYLALVSLVWGTRRVQPAAAPRAQEG